MDKPWIAALLLTVCSFAAGTMVAGLFYGKRAPLGPVAAGPVSEPAPSPQPTPAKRQRSLAATAGDAETARLTRQLAADRARLDELGSAIEAASTSADQLSQAVQSLPDRIQAQKNDIAVLQSQLAGAEADATVEQQLRASQARPAELATEARLAALRSQIAAAQRAVSEQRELITRTVAPENTTLMADYRDELARREARLASLRQQYADLDQSRLSAAGRALASEAAQFQRSRAARSNLAVMLSEASAALTQLEREYDQARASAADQDKRLEQLRDERAQLSAESEALASRLGQPGGR